MLAIGHDYPVNRENSKTIVGRVMVRVGLLVLKEMKVQNRCEQMAFPIV